MYYVPHIEIKTPADISVERHAEITDAIAKKNESLSRKQLISKDAAVGMAAAALSNSGCGACGIASFRRVSEK